MNRRIGQSLLGYIDNPDYDDYPDYDCTYNRSEGSFSLPPKDDGKRNLRILLSHNYRSKPSKDHIQHRGTTSPFWEYVEVYESMRYVEVYEIIERFFPFYNLLFITNDA